MTKSKNALAFVELYYSFVAYQQKVNQYSGDLKRFIASNMTSADIKRLLPNAPFASNILRGKAIHDRCHKYNMPWENLDWVNTFRHPTEAEAIFKEIEAYPGDYPEKIYAWATRK